MAGLEDSRQVTHEIEHYNLDGILAVGFRARSHRGTQFCQWAIGRLNEYLVKGFAKMHWATHEHTAAEVVAERADASKPLMGLHLATTPAAEIADQMPRCMCGS